MQYLDDVTTFSSLEVIFLLFSKIFMLSSNDFQKDPCINRYEQNEYFSLPWIFTQNMSSKAEMTLLRRSYFVTFEKMHE